MDGWMINYTYSWVDRQTDRQADRQTDRETDRQTEIQRYRDRLTVLKKEKHMYMYMRIYI